MEDPATQQSILDAEARANAEREAAEDAAFDAFVGDPAHYLPEDPKVRMVVLRGSLAKSKNTLLSLREDWRACVVANDAANAENYKAQIKGWMRAVDEKESQVRDLAWEICRGSHAWIPVLDGQPGICSRCQEPEPRPPGLLGTKPNHAPAAP